MVVIRYEGPKGGPGMQEMLYPTSYLKSKGLGKACALVTDGRFSGGSSGLSIGHVSPEAAEGGLIALVETGDTILIDIPNRTIRLDLDDAALAGRCRTMEAKGAVPPEAAWAASVLSRRPCAPMRRLRPTRRAAPCATSARSNDLGVRNLCQLTKGDEGDAGDGEPDGGGDQLDDRLAATDFDRRQADPSHAEDEAKPRSSILSCLR